MLSLHYENQNSSGLEKGRHLPAGVGRAGLSYPLCADVGRRADAAFCC